MLDKKMFDWTHVLLGVWLVISPWVVGFTASAGALRSAVIFGAAVIIVALWALYRPLQRGPEWVNAVLGVLLFLTPWAMGYRAEMGASWNAWALGTMIVVFAAYTFLPRMRIPIGTQAPRPH
jgi:SPW repeat